MEHACLLIYPVLLELCHFDGINGAFVAFVAETPTATVARLLQVVRSEQSVDDRNVSCGIQTGDALGYSLTDVVEVRCLTANDAAKDDDGIVAVVEGHLVGTVDELEGARNGLDMNVLRDGAMLFKGAHGSL